MCVTRKTSKQILISEPILEEKQINQHSGNSFSFINTLKQKNIPNKVSNFLTAKDLINLKNISRDFHGPIPKNTYLRWADKGGIGILRKEIKEAIKINQDEYADKCSCVCSTCIAGYITLPCTIPLLIGGCLGFFSGAAKDVCCNSIRQYDGQRIKFDEYDNVLNSRSVNGPIPELQNMDEEYTTASSNGFRYTRS